MQICHHVAAHPSDFILCCITTSKRDTSIVQQCQSLKLRFCCMYRSRREAWECNCPAWGHCQPSDGSVSVHRRQNLQPQWTIRSGSEVGLLGRGGGQMLVSIDKRHTTKQHSGWSSSLQAQVEGMNSYSRHQWHWWHEEWLAFVEAYWVGLWYLQVSKFRFGMHYSALFLPLSNVVFGLSTCIVLTFQMLVPSIKHWLSDLMPHYSANKSQFPSFVYYILSTMQKYASYSHPCLLL